MNEAADAAVHAEEQLEQAYLRDFPDEATARLEQLRIPAIAHILARQPPESLVAVWERMTPDVAGQVLTKLPDPLCVDILGRVDPGRVSRIVASLNDRDAARCLGLLSPEAAVEVREIMSYPADRAGALMDTRIRLFREDLSVRQVLARLRADRRPGRRGFFVVDEQHRLTGWVDMQEIALASRATRLAAIKGPVADWVEPTASREQVVDLIENRRLAELAVVDLDGRLLGVIRHAALLEAEKVEASAGIQTMVGVSRDERALSPVSFAVRKRLPWLQINLATAFLAAAVVGLFEATIAKYTALAILLPVVAGQSGNTGAQALAVTMRGLALREVRVRQWPRIVAKELYVGFWNGIAVAVTTALGVLLWSGSLGLTLVIGVSMVLSMVVAGAAGAAIPILLTLLRQDPAQSSSIVLTTVTDVAGFFSFLGIATALSAYL